MAFDSIRIRFQNVREWPSPLAGTRTVPFVESYFKVIKSCALLFIWLSNTFK